MKRTRIRVVGHSDTSDLKADIQALLRKIVIIRDGGCILRHYPETGACGPKRQDGKLVLQAEHLNSRTHSATFADLRNIVCLCQRHHGYWKPQNSRRYWEIIEKHLGPKHWTWLKMMEADKRAHKADWKLAKVVLEQELAKLKNE